jgi:hypothetical protein
MKRHWLVTVLAVLESLFGLAVFAFGAYLFKLSFIPEMTHTEAVSLRAAAAILGIPGLVWIALAALVFFVPRWGWWLGVGMNLTAAVVLSVDIAGTWRQSGWDDVALAAAVVFLTIFYLLPQVRRYRRSKAGEIPCKEIIIPLTSDNMSAHR